MAPSSLPTSAPIQLDAMVKELRSIANDDLWPCRSDLNCPMSANIYANTSDLQRQLAVLRGEVLRIGCMVIAISHRPGGVLTEIGFGSRQIPLNV